MSWDDEDFEVPVAATSAVNFDDEEDGLIGDDWEAAANSDDEVKKAPKPKAAPKPKLTPAERLAARKRAEQEEREKRALEKTMAAARNENMQRELDSDLSNASALLAAVDVHPRAKANNTPPPPPVPTGPAKLSDLAIFKAKTKSEYTDLRKTLVGVLNDLAEQNSMNLHSNFVLEVCRELIKPLPSAEVNKITDTLEALSKIKFKEERAKRLGSKAKPNVKAAPLKAVEKPQSVAAADEDDGLSDGDFM